MLNGTMSYTFIGINWIFNSVKNYQHFNQSLHSDAMRACKRLLKWDKMLNYGANNSPSYMVMLDYSKTI